MPQVWTKSPLQRCSPLVHASAQSRVTDSGLSRGSAPSVLLRGATSINASGRDQEPLYIVDGVILGSTIVDIEARDDASGKHSRSNWKEKVTAQQQATGHAIDCAA